MEPLRFKIQKMLGQGGMGTVFLAEDRQESRRVAVKFLNPGLERGLLDLFRQEVLLLARLSHPALVKVFDYYDSLQEFDGPPNLPSSPCFAMEYVDGVSIDQGITRLDATAIIDLFVQLCRGLHYLHAHGVLHRDLKPSNILIGQERRAKILDFGLAGTLHDTKENETMGTLDYLSPEALGGSYSPQSDLFALGAVFREILSGRSDLPQYFSELIDHLLEKDLSRRPSSALAVLKYLQQHSESPFDLQQEESSLTAFLKVPWVHRDEEDLFWNAVHHKRGFIAVIGPAGVGRTRFIEEAKWRLETEGIPFRFFPDLHEKSDDERKRLLVSLKPTVRTNPGLVIILEYDNGGIPYVEGIEITEEIRLEDLTPEQTLEMIRQATVDRPLSEEVITTIAQNSGGRPLLVVELLREARQDFHSSCKTRLGRLTEDGLRLLAIIASEEAPVPLFEILPLWEGTAGLPEEKFRDAQLELQSQGLIAPTSDGLGLAHPSLRDTYLSSLPSSIRQETDRLFIRFLTERLKEAVVGPEAVRITTHALSVGDSAISKEWGPKAVEHHFNLGHYNEANRLCEELLKSPLPQLTESLLYAFEAPAFYRLGLYEKSIHAYDEWFARKPDDGTGVEKVKHLFYTGLALFGWGRIDEARKRLTECLKTGDSKLHRHHRPYHARAHALLASLDEKDQSWDEAASHLHQASLLAEGLPILLGEIEQQRGLMDQSLLKHAEALDHFRESARCYGEAKSPQAEAIAANYIGMLLRETGELTRSLESMNRALSLSAEGGEILQQGRYLQNRALVLMDLGRYGESLDQMRKARDILEVYGDDNDRFFASAHEISLQSLLGNQDRADTLLKTMEQGVKDGAPPKFCETVRLLRGGLDGRKKALSVLEQDEVLCESDLQGVMKRLESIENPETRIELASFLATDFNRRGLPTLSLCFRNIVLRELETIHRQLPEELKMDFEKKRDLQSLDQTLAGLLPKSEPASPQNRISETRFRQYCAINREIAAKNDLTGILERVIDAAIEMTGAERGFLIFKNEAADGSPGTGSPIKGYEVKTARHINHRSLSEKEFQFSLTAVRQCVSQGTFLLTDDAQMDPRLQQKKSVVRYHLKSMLIVPLELEGEVLGAIYLDHRLQPGCFSDEDVLLLNAFASQAALAIQKAHMMEELARAKEGLEGQVKVQALHIETLAGELAKARGQLRYGYEEIVGQSPAMMKVFQLLDHVTETTIPVWIFGESGTGKELVARSLHYNSPRKGGPFVAENVSAIPETLLESELFGHKKGAFTHADRDRIGLFEQATGGTLFLDEIADMPLAMQAKLLRVLQEGEVRPVGSSKTVKINIRLVTASNRDLNRLVKDGKFRQDLFFRINGMTIPLPPLRERRDDIPLLSRELIKKLSQEFSLPTGEITDEGMRLLMSHNWSGNVRELESTLRNALLFAKGRPVGPEFLNLGSPPPSEGTTPTARPEGETSDDATERQLILEALRKCGLNKEAAAKALGMSLRSLYNQLDRLKIPKKKTLLTKYLGC